MRFMVTIVTLLFVTATSAISNKAVTFTDKDLRAYLKAHPNGIIYILSSNMYLSLKGYPEYQSIAKRHKIPFLALHDPFAPNRENALRLNIAKIPTVQSKELISRGGVVHFPSFIFHKNSTLDPFVSPGYESPDQFENRIKKFFK